MPIASKNSTAISGASFATAIGTRNINIALPPTAPAIIGERRDLTVTRYGPASLFSSYSEHQSPPRADLVAGHWVGRPRVCVRAVPQEPKATAHGRAILVGDGRPVARCVESVNGFVKRINGWRAGRGRSAQSFDTLRLRLTPRSGQASG